MNAREARRIAINISPIFQDMRDSGEIRRLEEVGERVEKRMKKEKEKLKRVFNGCLKHIRSVAEKGEFKTEIPLSRVDVAGLIKLFHEEGFYIELKEGCEYNTYFISW